MKAFLFLSAKRRCINYIRESKRTTPINTTDEFIDNAEINSILIDELDKLINKEVSKLPWRQRQIAEMIIFGLTEDEIAKELKVSKKVVFNLKYILSATLKLKLKNYIKMSP
jgi:DNA-directed RNA polymerase specialized sigma24 family protein